MTIEFQPVRKTKATRRWMLCSIALLSGVTLAAEVVRSEYLQGQPTGTHSVVDQLFISLPSETVKRDYGQKLRDLMKTADYAFSDALALPRLREENGVVAVVCAPERRISSPEEFNRLILAPNDIGLIPIRYTPRMMARPELGALVIKEIPPFDRTRREIEMVYVSFREGRNIWLKTGISLQFSGGNEKDIYTGFRQLLRYNGKFNTRPNRISIGTYKSILNTPKPYARVIDEAFPRFR